MVGNAADTHDPEYICGVAGNAALTAFSQSLGCVSAKDGIRVVALSPGPVETDRIVTLMKKKAKDRTGDENNWQELRKPLPFQRCATPEEIGAAWRRSSPRRTPATPAARSSPSTPASRRAPAHSEREDRQCRI